MKTFLIILLFFMSSCGFQPIYLNKNLNNFEFLKIDLIGDDFINNKIINSLLLKENNNANNLFTINISSSYAVREISKNQKGQAETYRSTVMVDLKIFDKENLIKNKIFSEETTFNKNDNKFDLSQNQIKIRNQLIDRVIENIIIFLNTE
jgi:hypothetical protein